MKENYVVFKTERTMYSPDQCNINSTLTVRQLKDILENYYDDDMHIFFMNDNGYTYGIITENHIDEIEADEESDE